jgi:chemotaxis methyl-accepting protein methylase
MKEKNSVITDLLLKVHGVDVSKYDDSFLSRSLQKRFKATNCDSAKAYYKLLEQDGKEAANFLNSLNISYTEFFRNPLTFAILERILLPSIASENLKTRRKEIRIWSAACAAGQETYSLAMLLEELISVDNRKINFRIFATDQDDIQVNKAIEGRYSANALDNVRLKRVKQWFTQLNDSFAIKPELKKNIDFSVFDLVNEQLGCPPASIFGDFDLVVCANLLFYYKPEYQKIIVEKAGKCLANGGYLITGETERDILLGYNFREVFPQSAIFQKINK